jgi:putative hydrolase of the HAD superfamily
VPDAPVRAVLFDVDDTLVDHAGARRRGILAHLRACGLAADDDAVRRWRLAEERHFARHLAGELSFQEQRRERVRDVLARPLADDEADAWFAGYTECFEREWSAFPDVTDCLQSLAPYALGVVTNVGVEHQRRKLARCGLADRFEAVVGLDTLGVGKPDPRPFRHACAQLGVRPEQAVYVGDRLDWDVAGAVGAGLRAVWLDRRGEAAGADVPTGVPVLATLDGLAQTLGALDRGRLGAG